MSQERPRRPTRASVALGQWMKDNGYTQEALAAALRREGEKLRQATVSSWVLGLFVPSVEYLVRIAELTGIPIAWWTEPAVLAHEPAEARTG